ncbi:UNVERIFIED_CONTAM: hypothetical protein Sradi_5289800 [Sesamum radiatum]|uniref:MULE transposase domain-containing protein n=1 Tax=Sesamum radiatum TaxID=300843 RepID=A0AAW2LMN2_SESRA
MSMQDSTDGATARKFDKFNVCFGAMKQGFKVVCRTVIGEDGYHLKGPFGQVLLTTVGVDPNNNLFSIAYAIVNGETRASWERFLKLIKSDLDIARDDVYTFISDKQKCLVPTFKSVFQMLIINSV